MLPSIPAHSTSNSTCQVFPQVLSPRQFRIAIKQLISITSPPMPIIRHQPLLASTILQITLSRIQTASTQRLTDDPDTIADGGAVNNSPTLSEQAVLALSLIDSLPFLEYDILEDWLYTSSESIYFIKDPELINVCRQRFWEVLSNGEMDVNKAALCVTWWNTRGGREMVLYGPDAINEEALMSGALDESSKL